MAKQLPQIGEVVLYRVHTVGQHLFVKLVEYEDVEALVLVKRESKGMKKFYGTLGYANVIRIDPVKRYVDLMKTSEPTDEQLSAWASLFSKESIF